MTDRNQAINFEDKLSRFTDRWAPKIVAQMNDYQFKLVKIQGEFVWHRHADTDEEPCGVVNTGNAGGDMTAANDIWI
jgi:hypothetical protein